MTKTDDRRAQAPSSVLDLTDIQGDILRAYGNDYDCTTYVWVTLSGGPKAGREFIASLAEQVTNAAPWKSGKPSHHLNVALTVHGLKALGVRDDVIASFSSEFRQGMKDRHLRLGDIGRNHPDHWEPWFQDGRAHVLVTVNALTQDDLKAALAPLRTSIKSTFGHAIADEEPANLLTGQREHFGFADGFAQPAIEGVTDDKARGGGVPQMFGRWRALAPGEFILGYPDEDTRDDPEKALPSAPDDPLGKSGTYMVWRKLKQDVGRFRQTVAAAAERYEGGDEAKLRAKIVGRWDNGAPLVEYPDAPPAGEFDGKAEGANDFRFMDDDESGGKCPIGAHVRRSNPRDALGWDGALSFRHRIIRRGMPYGPPLPADATKDDGKDRGLVFIAFNASISRQFEAIQVQWLNDGNVFGLGHDSDYLMGGEDDTERSMVIQGEQPFYLSPQPPFVSTKGGEYLFVPGIAALRALGAGDVS